MKILIHGNFGPGQHSAQRADALDRLSGVTVHRIPFANGKTSILRRGLSRLSAKLRQPHDVHDENARLIVAARQANPDVVLIENSRIVTTRALRRIKNHTGAHLSYFCPDDFFSPVVLTRQLKQSIPVWDTIFTTKHFNIAELKTAGAVRPILVLNIFDPDLYRPLSREEVGPEFECYDYVFVGAYERDRAQSIMQLAEGGRSVVVYGYGGFLSGDWRRLKHDNIIARPSVWGEDYVHAMHKGKVALGFLRKINRDEITQRSIEAPAMARCMLAEKTEQHDAHFADGAEYVGFTDDDSLKRLGDELLSDPDRRRSIALAGYERCHNSGYDVDTLARHMIRAFSDKGAGSPA